MSNVLKIYVENPDEILNAGHSGAGAVVQVQNDTTDAFAAPSDTGTVAIVTATRAYTFYHAAGGTTTWYRTRYETSAGVATSDWSTPFQVGSYGYCQLDDVKQRLGRADVVDDELFSEYITEATDYIRGYIGRDLIDTALTHTLDGYDAVYGGRCLFIPRGVRSLSLLETAATTGATFSTVTAGTYFLRPTDTSPGWPATELWLSDVSGFTFPRGIANVRLTGTFGFGQVPERVQEVALNLVVRSYASRQAGQADLLGAGGEGGAPLVSSYLSKRDRDTLAGFRSVLVG